MLETDALNSIIANVFSQRQLDKHWYLIAYYLKTIANTKLNYPIYNKEILAIIFSF